MKRYKIELTEEQIILMAQCLEDVSRFAMGQPSMEYTISKMVHDLPFEEAISVIDHTERHLEEARNVLFPDLACNASLSYNSNDFIGNTYQMYRTILHKLAIDNSWNNVYTSPALPSGTLGSITVERVD